MVMVIVIVMLEEDRIVSKRMSINLILILMTMKQMRHSKLIILRRKWTKAMAEIRRPDLLMRILNQNRSLRRINTLYPIRKLMGIK